MFSFNRGYFSVAVILFVTEVIIAIYVHDDIVRPYVGDFLVVILIYCFIRTFLRSSTIVIALGTLLFSYLVEALQYLHFVAAIGLKDNELANIVLGNSFAWTDILAYTLGIITVIVTERVKSNFLSKDNI